MKRKRRRKIILLIKRVLLIIFILLLITFLGLIALKFLKSHDKKEIKQEIDLKPIVEKINNEDIDINFLEWIKTTYKEKTIIDINNKLDESGYQEEMWHQVTGNTLKVLKYLYSNKEEDNIKYIKESKDEITLSFIGDVSLADNWYIMPKYDERNKKIYGILSEEVVEIMNKSDIMVANNEFTISNRGEKIKNKAYTFRASPERLSIYKEMGVDLVTLANNHVYDFGDDAFFDTLTSLDEYDIPYIGAGKNIEEAKKIYYFIINGYKIAFVNSTRAEKFILTKEATENEGGVLRSYDTTAFKEVISKAKETSDYVVALVHFGKEDSHSLEEVQIKDSKEYIDMGADIVIGTHAHVLQGIEFYNNKPIIYNLGDFIFNNETKDTGIFQIKITYEGNLEYYFIPCEEKEEYTRTLEGNEKQKVINKMNTWSINANMDELGKITEK